jgi:hypothetical protein
MGRIFSNLRVFQQTVRLGTPELTHFGMKEPQMVQIANLISDVLLNERPNLIRVKREVLLLREKFGNINYCFEPERPVKVRCSPSGANGITPSV